ncbi:TPA: DUF4258 domain-containing protein [Candidatus Poribacteria bacterium]|nr:DUF4258 domain-containing protein [Candidatus Poribacteria bacterium]
MMQIPQEIVRLIQQRRYLLSSKARNQLHVGRFSTEDLLNSIIYGRVTKKERDETGKARYKYTIIGPALSGEQIYSCGKIVYLDRKTYFVITFHESR